MTKVMLKRVMRGKLPESILRRAKIGFYTPSKYWIKNELKAWMTDIIFSRNFKSKGIFNQVVLKKIFNEHISGAADNSKILWTVVNFELWYNKYFTKGDNV